MNLYELVFLLLVLEGLVGRQCEDNPKSQKKMHAKPDMRQRCMRADMRTHQYRTLPDVGECRQHATQRRKHESMACWQRRVSEPTSATCPNRSKILQKESLRPRTNPLELSATTRSHS